MIKYLIPPPTLFQLILGLRISMGPLSFKIPATELGQVLRTTIPGLLRSPWDQYQERL